MEIGRRLKEIRQRKNLSQGDIEARSGLQRCYISRAENGHTVPTLETLEKLARALEVPMYEIFYEGKKPPKANSLKIEDKRWGAAGRDARTLNRFRALLAHTDDKHRKLLLLMAQRMSAISAPPDSTLEPKTLRYAPHKTG